LVKASARCGCAIHWVAIKYRWRRAVDSTERAALLNLLSGFLWRQDRDGDAPRVLTPTGFAE
jgi:hypothetical protein